MTHPSSQWAEPGFVIQQSWFRNVFRVLKQLIRPLRGDRTLPTPVGLVLIALALAIGTAAYNTSSNILFMTLSLLLSCLLLSGVLAWMNLNGTRWRIVLAPHFRVEEDATVRLELVNTKTLLPTCSLCFHMGALNSGVAKTVCQTEGLEPGESTQLSWRFKPQRRGTETIAITGLESQFPFGFLRKCLSGGLRHEVVVWPRRIPYDFKPVTGRHWRQQGQTVRKPGGGTDMINLREYRSGDPIRLMHWKASARSGQMMVREMSEEHEDAYFILVETPARLWKHPAQFEAMCSLAGSMAEDLFRRRQLRGGAVNDQPAIAIKGLSDVHRFLDLLAVVQPVERYTPIQNHTDATTVTFRPGNETRVNIYVGAQYSGTA